MWWAKTSDLDNLWWNWLVWKHVLLSCSNCLNYFISVVRKFDFGWIAIGQIPLWEFWLWQLKMEMVWFENACCSKFLNKPILFIQTVQKFPFFSWTSLAEFHFCKMVPSLNSQTNELLQLCWIIWNACQGDKNSLFACS